MKGCKADNQEELNDLVKNGGDLYETRNNQTQDQTAEYLAHTTANFEKINSRYQTKDAGAILDTTITTKISEKSKAKFAGKETAESLKNLDTRARVGTMIHALNELIGKELYNTIKDKTTVEALDYLNNTQWKDVSSTIGPKMYAISKESRFDGISIAGTVTEEDRDNLKALFDGQKDILIQIYNRQKYINRRLNTDGNVKLMFEQIIVDPKYDIGGTADLIALYSDNTASVFDFKTKIPYKKFVDKSGKLISYDYINSYDKEKYKAQLAAIQRILVNRYGVKQVVQSRIVPIQINVPFDSETNLIGNHIKDIYYGAKQNQFLAQHAPLPELTGFKDLDDFLLDIEKRIKAFEGKIKTDPTNRDFYRNKVSELQLAKQSILVKHNFNDLIHYANNLLDQSTHEKLGNLTLDQLRELKDELKSFSLLAGATYEYRTALGADGKNDKLILEIENTIRGISSQVSDRLYDVETELYNVRIADTVNKLSGYSILDQSGRFITFNDEGFFGKYWNKLSEFQNPIFKSFRALLDDAQYETRNKVKNTVDNIIDIDNRLRNWMKQNNKDEQWLINALINQDVNSHNADNLHNKLSKEFRERLKELKETKNIKEIIKIYEPHDGYNVWFNNAKEDKKTYFDRIYRDDKLSKLNYDRWISNHDLSLNKDGSPKYPDAWVNQLGKLKIKDSVAEANYSDEYNYIKSIPELFAYYEMFENYNKEFRNILGVDYYQLPNNFLPNIRKSNIDRLLDNGIMKGGKEVFDNFMKELNVREDDMMYGELDPETGQLKKTIPRFFINAFRNKNGQVLIGEKSYDLTKSLILFSRMAYNYEQMSKIEGTSLALRDLLSEKGEQVIKRGGKAIKDFVGNELASKIEGKDIENIFQSFIDLYLYGVSVNPISDNSSGKYEKLVLQAKQYFTLKSLGFGFIPATGSFLAAKIQAVVEGSKGQVYTSEQYKNSMKFLYNDREKLHALTAFFDPMAVEYDFFAVDGKSKKGIGDPRERNKIKKYVNSRLLLRSFSAGDEFIDEVILSSMAQNFYIDNNGDLRRMRDDNDREKYKDRSIWSLFSYDGNNAKLDIDESKLKDIIIKFRRAAQSAQSKIKGMIPEEDKAYWQTQIVGQVLMHFKSWMPGIIKERFGSTGYNDALQLVEMGRFSAFGKEVFNAEQASIPVFMKEILAPKLLELAKHLVWYNGTKSNPRIKLSYEHWIDNNPQYKGVVSFDDYLAAQKAQMKALIIELRILLSFAMMIALLGADFDDDGKKLYQETWITRKLVAILSKTNNEISFTYNPAEFAAMVKNPIPLAGILVDATNVLANTYDETIDITFGEKFPLPFHKPQKQDSTPKLYYTSKLIPGASQLEKLLEIFNKNTGTNP